MIFVIDKYLKVLISKRCDPKFKWPCVEMFKGCWSMWLCFPKHGKMIPQLTAPMMNPHLSCEGLELYSWSRSSASYAPQGKKHLESCMVRLLFFLSCARQSLKHHESCMVTLWFPMYDVQRMNYHSGIEWKQRLL